MPRFKYSARDKDAKLIYGIIEHIDQDEAIAALQSRGLIVVSINAEKKAGKSGKTAKKLKRGIKADDVTFFCRQMSTLLNAGVTLLRGLAIISRETTSGPLYKAVEEVRTDVEEGRSLHDAMAKHPKIFQSLWVSLIEAGEASGQLAPAFDHIAIYLERTSGVMRKVKGAMVYPVILIAVSLAAILIFTLKIIPMFGEIYKGFDIELPALTLGVLKLSEFMRHYAIFIIGLCAGIIFIIKNLISKTQPGRYIFDTITLKVPLFGPLVQGMIIERFAHGLGTLIKSGIPILSGLDIVGKVCGNKLFENTIELVREDVRAGRTMSSTLEASGLFPSIVTQMIAIGEETGKLSEMLERVQVYYQDRINSTVDRMTAAFEPLILIFMGSTVGVLIAAMYLPIFKIATGGGVGK